MAEYITLAQFLSQTRTRTAWCSFGVANVYCRMGAAHAIDGEVHACFDIANISIPNEAQRRRGVFKSLIRYLRSTLPDEVYIYVENVNNLHLANYLRNAGWGEINMCVHGVAGAPPCFYSRVAPLWLQAE